MKIAVICHGLKLDNLRLQPWRYILELINVTSLKHKVVVFTNGKDTFNINNIEVIGVGKLKPVYESQFTKQLKLFDPNIIIVGVTPRSINWSKWLNMWNIPKIGLFTTPLYEWKYLFNSLLHGCVRDSKPHVINNMFGLKRFSKFSKQFATIIVQSQKNFELLQQHNVNTTHIKVGMDINDLEGIIIKENKKTRFQFLYLGSPKRVRGIFTLIKAFRRVVDLGINAELVILSRTVNQENRSELLSVITGYEKDIKLIEGFLEPSEVREYIGSSDCIVMPFILVPSDTPIAILESIQQGKPLLSTCLDGIPSMVKNRGIICQPNQNSIKEGLLNMVNAKKNKTQYYEYVKSCQEFSKEYPSWDIISNEALELIELVGGERL